MTSKPEINDSINSVDVSNVTDLVKAPYEEVEYGRAVLVALKQNGAKEKHSGRVIQRNYPFVTLRRGTYTVEINLEDMNWNLDDWMPIRSSVEKLQIEQEYSKRNKTVD